MEQLPAASLAALREHLARVRHDLGKYVAFQARWLPGGAGIEELRGALSADLARTRSCAGRVESAPEIWERLRPALVGAVALEDGSRVDLSNDADFLDVEAGIAVVREVLPALPSAPPAVLEGARTAALGIAAALQRLTTRARAAERV
jgi:hypothetical protein